MSYDDPDYVCPKCGQWASKMDGCDCEIDQHEENQADDRRDMMREMEKGEDE